MSMKKNNWLKRTILITLVLTAVIIALPYAIQFGIIKGLKSAGIVEASIDDVDFNLFTAELAVKKLHAQRLNQPDIDVALIHIGVDWLPLFSKRFYISSLTLKNSSITVLQTDETHLYVGGLLIPLENDSADDSESKTDLNWGIGVNKLVLSNNTFIIKTPQFSHNFTISELSLDNALSWQPDHSAAFAFNTTLNKAPISGNIHITAFADNPTIKGHINIDKLALNIAQPFIQQQDIELSGLLQTDLDFSILLNNGSIEYKQSGLVSITNSAVVLPDLRLQHENISWKGNINLQRVDNKLAIQSNGELSAKKHQSNLASPTLKISIGSIHWQGSTQIKTGVNETSLSVKGGFKLNDLISSNPQTQLQVAALKQLSIKQVELTQIEDIKLSGVVLSGITLAKKLKQQALVAANTASFETLQIQNLKQIELSKVQLDSLLTQLSINQQGDLPLVDSLSHSLKPTQSSQRVESTSAANNNTPTQIKIAGLQLTGNSKIKLFKATKNGNIKNDILINKFEIGELNTQASEQQTPISIKATIDKHAKILVDGKIAFFSKRANASIKSTLSAIELHGYSPVIREQIGYSIQNGQLNAELNIKIKNDLLNGKTKIEINQLVLEVTDSNIAAKLTQQLPMPLDSTLSLLRDDKDDIKLDIPIKGNIASPDFNISDVINTALGNALQGSVKNYLKYALQPYGLIYMAAEKAYGVATAVQLEAIKFSAGQVTLPPSAATFFEKIGTLMQKRPGLRIKVCGIATATDQAALVPAAKPTENQTNAATINKEQLLALAKNRAAAVKTYLITNYAIDAKRLFTCAAKIDVSEKGDTPRVELSI